jgi:hypothetical protein
MSFGPITIFDKSALESLSVDEAVWLDAFYRPNITPLYYVETLADLEKEVRGGRTPEQVVGHLAEKTPNMGSLPNILHSTIALGELMGQRIEMHGFPLIAGGTPVESGGRKGIIFNEMPEFQAFQRWQEGRFLDVERLFARVWRAGLSGLDFSAAYRDFQPYLQGTRPRDLGEVKVIADRILEEWEPFGILQLAFDLIGIPADYRDAIRARWRLAGQPRFRQFAPYAAHIVLVDLVFYLGIAADLIGRERPSNKIDVGYLYYLPFCMVFTSKDNLHRRLAPLLIGEDKLFVTSEDLKAELKRLDEYYSTLPGEVKERGVMSFATYPPAEGDFLTTRLWDRFLPKWRENAQREGVPLSNEAEAKVVAMLRDFKDKARPLGPEVKLDVQSAEGVMFQRAVPMRMGKWRLLPPEVERQQRETGSPK